MSKKGYLTAEEYSAMCKFLHMKTDELVCFHRVQNRSTINRWQSGKSFVSEQACDDICRLFDTVVERVEFALSKIYEQNKDECQIVLIIYPEACKDMIFGFKDAGIPLPAFNSIAEHVYAEATAHGYDIGLIGFNPQAYMIWLSGRGLEDTPDNRSAWAAETYAEFEEEKA